MKTEFAGGSKYEDISKVSSVTPLLRWQVVIIYQIIVFAAHNILSKNVSELFRAGYVCIIDSAH